MSELFAGRFRLRRRLQERADRDVWLATDTVLRQTVCLHELAPALVPAEAERAKQWSGPGALISRGVWQHDGRGALVFAWPQPSVWLSQVEPVSADRALGWLIDAAVAVDRAHRTLGPLGRVRVERAVVSGGALQLDLSGEPVADCTVADDIAGLGALFRHALGGRVEAAPSPWAQASHEERWRGVPPGLPRGVRELLLCLIEPDDERRPATAAVVAWLARRVRKHPKRALGRVRTVPTRPAACVQVLAQEPCSGRWVRMGEPTTRRTARRAARLVQRRGWPVRQVPVALGWPDLAWMVALTLFGALVLPLLGGVVALWASLRWRRARCRPGIGEASPVLWLQLTPRPTGRWRVALLGLSLVATALSLWWLAPLAVLPAGLAVGLLWDLWRADGEGTARLARRARVHSAELGADAALAISSRPLDERLGLQGQLLALLDHLEQRPNDDVAVAQVEQLLSRAVESEQTLPG